MTAEQRNEAARRIGTLRGSWVTVTQRLSACIMAGRTGAPLYVRVEARGSLREAVLKHEAALDALKTLLDIHEPVPPVHEGRAEEC